MNLKNIMKRFNKRNILTLSLIMVIFVMSLGYAALSQYMEIEGMAIIDRSWIIKITEVTSTVTNSGVNNSNTYVGTTVTLDADLPNVNSTVTYTIKLKNEGNLKAKLHSIEKIEDDNTSITYTLSGVEEGVTTLNPGEENIVTVTIKANTGVTNLSDTNKKVMVTFNYVENSVDSNGVPTNPVEYDEYIIGDKVNLVDGSIWYVVKDSNSTEEYVTIMSDTSYGNYIFETGDKQISMYDPTKETNIGYKLNTTVLPNIKTTIDNNGGNSIGTTIRLLTYSEYNTFTSLGKSFGTNETWLMTESSDTLVRYYNNGLTTKAPTEEGATRPVIITLKENVTLSGHFLVDQIKADNVDPTTNNQVPSDGVNSTYVNNTTPGVNFGEVSGYSSNGKGLYVTSDLTKNEDIDGDGVGEPVYYYRGNVKNNFVKFGKNTSGNALYWQIVRINEDGSIRLIFYSLNGLCYEDIEDSLCYPIEGGIYSELVGNTNYSYSGTTLENAYIGYMYGATGQSGNNAYKLTHTNDNSSTIKVLIDNWYTNNTNLSSFRDTHLADAGFCNDRSVAPTANTWASDDTALGYAGNKTYYGAYNRLINNKSPQFKCQNADSDLFTTGTSNKGNKALSNPIGLITADEVSYAGGVYGENSKYFYLSLGGYYWTMTPSGNASIFSVHADMEYDGGPSETETYMTSMHLGTNSVYDYAYVRPVINLKPRVELSDELPSGCKTLNGTRNCPYIIKTN